MRKILVMVLLSVACAATANDRLDFLFDNLSKRAGAVSTQVDFTGGWPSSGGQMGFAMMRGTGKGHTRGERVGLACEDVFFVDSIFDKLNNENAWGSEYYKTCPDESKRTIYSLYFNEKSDSLYMIRATFEEEPSLPYDWPFRTHYDASDSVQTFTQVPISRTPTDWSEVLTRLYEEVKYNFVFYPRISSRWDSVYKRSLKALKAASDDFEKLRILQRMVAFCGDGHTYVIFSGGDYEQPAVSPFTTVMLPEGLFIRTVESQQLLDAGMRRGQKIIAVNGDNPELWAERELKPYVCSSTPQWTIQEMYDGYGFTRMRQGTQMDLTLENPDGTRFEFPHRVGETQWTSSLVSSPELSFKVIKQNIGVLTIPSFQKADVTEFFDKAFPEISETDALIIDLRGNGGGNSSYANYIAKHLIDEPIAENTWSTRIYKPAFASWGMEEEVFESPRDSLTPVSDKTPYLKAVVLLTDRGTFSAAEDFVSLLKAARRITQIGTPTGGSTGNGVRPVLSANGSVSANICSKHDVAADGTEFVGVGLIPDVVLEETATSYFDPEKDEVIDAAIRYLDFKK